MPSKQIHEIPTITTPSRDDLLLVSTNAGSLTRSASLASLPYDRGESGSTPRTISEKLGETVSVTDFGAVGDGVADDAPAFQAALDSHQCVSVPAGTFRLATTIDVLPRRRLAGSGRDTTIIQAEGTLAFVFHRNAGAHQIDAAAAADWNRSSIADMTIRMATGGIRAVGHEFRLRDVSFFGGTATSQVDLDGWCVDMVDANECHLSGISAGYGGGIKHAMNANGIRWRSLTVGVNYGDSLVEEVSIKLGGADTAAILLDGHTATASTHVCNNMVLQRIQANAPQGGVGNTPLAGTNGIKLWNSARICLLDCNIEALDVAFEEYSEQAGGAAGACIANSFLGCYTFSCNTRYRDSNDAFPGSVVQRHFIGCDNLGPITNGSVSGDGGHAQDGDAFLQGAWIADGDGNPSVQLRSRTKDTLIVTGDYKGSAQLDADGHPSQQAPYHGFLLDIGSKEAAKITRPIAHGATDPDNAAAGLSDVRLELGNGEGDPRGELSRVQINDPLQLAARNTQPLRPLDGLVHHAASASAMPSTGEWYLGPGIYARVNGGEYPPVAVQRGAVPEKERNGDFTVSDADFGKILRVNHGSDRVVTIPAGIVPAGAGARRFWVVRQGTGRVTFQAGSGLTIRSTGDELSIARQYQMVEVILRDNDEAYLIHIMPDALERYEKPLHWTAGNVVVPASYLGKLVRVSSGSATPVYVELPTGIVPIGMDAVSLEVMKAGTADVEIRAGTGMTLASPAGDPYTITQQNKIVEIVVTSSSGNQPNTIYISD